MGRQSELINVGGEKVYPQEVENVILEVDNIVDVMVYSEKNQIMGNIVCADIELFNDLDKKNMLKEIKNYCLSKLERYKVPIKINFVDSSISSERFKKKRKIEKVKDERENRNINQ